MGEAGAPLLGSPLGWARIPRVGKKQGGCGGGSARRAGLSFVRGFARRDQDCSSLLTLAGGHSSTPAGVQAVSCGGGGEGCSGVPRPKPEKPLPRRLSLQSLPPPPPLPSRRGSLLAPPPSSSQAVRAARSRASKGAARAGPWQWRRWKGEESRPPPEQFQPAAGERAARCERGGLAPLVWPERSLLFPARSLHAGTVTAAGGEDGRRAGGGVVEKRDGCLSCSPRRGGWGPGTCGGLGGGAHRTWDSTARGTN